MIKYCLIPNKTVRFVLSLTIALMFICVGEAYAQSVVRGKVTSSSSGEALLGATVVVSGSNTGTATDINGEFSIKVKEGEELEVNYLGYMPSRVVVSGAVTNYSIKLIEDATELEDVVVVGYGTMRKKEVTGAVTRVDSEEFSKIATADLGTALQGLVAGVNVQASSGEPGASSNIQIRGISSVTGSNSPLFVVDGVPYESDPKLSDNEIESIDVLKDAASAAIYGTRGAGGVILITTKTGQAGKMKVSATGYYGVQNITSQIDLLDAAGLTYVSMISSVMNSTGANTTADRAYTNLRDYPNKFLNDADAVGVITNNMAPIQNYAVNLSGGSKTLTYNFSGSLYKQEGVIINSSLERYNFRANLNYKSGNWKINTSTSFGVQEQISPGYQLLLEAYKYSATLSDLDPDASIFDAGTETSSSALTQGEAIARIKQSTTAQTNNFNGNYLIGYTILEGLELSTRASVGYSNVFTVGLKPLFEIYDSDGELVSNSSTRSWMRNTYARTISTASETMLNYDKSIGKHNFKATGVFSIENTRYNSFYAEVDDLSSNSISNLNASSTNMAVGTGTGQWGQDRSTSLVGTLARIQYNYDQKYLFSASIRRDGSSRFAESNRWGLFPSVSAGWNISSEKFWERIAPVISSLKLRASHGTTGNQSFSDYEYTTYMTTGYDYLFGSTYVGSETLELGTASSAFSNADVKWETTKQTNVGLDFGFLKNSKLTFSIDAYMTNKDDMLFSMQVPPSAGAGSSSTVTLNVGNMQNKGIELSASYRDKIGKVGYRITATASTNKNEITDMGGINEMYYFTDGTPVAGSSYSDLVTGLKVGEAAGSFFMMPTNGVIKTESQLVEYQKLNSNARMGDLIYVDTDGSGVLDDNDRVNCGNGAPEYELGFVLGLDYKGFDLSANFYASLGNEVINGSKIYTYQNMRSADLAYAWSYNNVTSDIPAYRGTTTHDNYRGYADIWVEDGSFLRLKNFTVGYTVPTKYTSRIKIAKLRVYFAADNLLTITGYTGYDPEVGSNGLSKRGLDVGTYPISRQMRGGVQLDF